MDDEQVSEANVKRLRDALGASRKFASQVAIHVFTISKAPDLQNEANVLIEQIDEALYGDTP